MSLYEQYREPFVRLDKQTLPGVSGGTIEVWTDGEPFQAALVRLSDSSPRLAGQTAHKTAFRLMFSQPLTLAPGDRVLQTRTGQAFLITSHSRDAQTPACSGLNLCLCAAERVTLC